MLLDRADELERLERLLAQVEAERSGAAVLVSGEAGVGKTALLKGFADGSAGRARILRAGCEPLLAARPIGPFDDLAQALGGELRELVGDHGKPHAIAMRKRGVRSIPRGPRETTRSNPAGLTAREVDVVALLVEGLRNAEIAERLVVSQKTVNHHVSAILRKLEVSTRREAADAAVGLGIVPRP